MSEAKELAMAEHQPFKAEFTGGWGAHRYKTRSPR